MTAARATHGVSARRRHTIRVCALGALVAAHAGCAGSQPSRFYRLHPVVRPASKVDVVSRPGSQVVGVGPIRVPDYLDRPQIVTVSGDAMQVADFDRWVGSIGHDITRVLVEDLAVLLPPERYFVTEWPTRPVPLSYRIEVIVERFEGPIHGPVSLSARWFVVARDGQLLLNRSSSVLEQVAGGGGYGAFVEAMSRALEGLSRVIARDVTSLSSEQDAAR